LPMWSLVPYPAAHDRATGPCPRARSRTGRHAAVDRPGQLGVLPTRGRRAGPAPARRVDGGLRGAGDPPGGCGPAGLPDVRAPVRLRPGDDHAEPDGARGVRGAGPPAGAAAQPLADRVRRGPRAPARGRGQPRSLRTDRAPGGLALPPPLGHRAARLAAVGMVLLGLVAALSVLGGRAIVAGEAPAVDPGGEL